MSPLESMEIICAPLFSQVPRRENGREVEIKLGRERGRTVDLGVHHLFPGINGADLVHYILCHS